ncbi:MAG: hypothetical protein QM478_07320 [Flavobacteriaceae bacterium]
MKKTIFLFLFISNFTVNSQSWDYKSGGNAFDGKYKTSSIQGTGTDYPYHNPMLVINVFKEESLNFYIASAGYFPDKSEMEILWVFSNEPNTFYTSYNFSLSVDSKTIFLSEFKNLNTHNILSELEFIEKLKTAKTVSVRIKNEYGKNDIEFSLRGSTKAIEYVISKNYLKKIDELNKEVELLVEKYLKEAKEEEIATLEYRERILNLLSENGINDSEERRKVLDRIMNYDESLDWTSIDSLSFNIRSIGEAHFIDLEVFSTKNNWENHVTYIQSLIPNSIEKLIADKKKEKEEILIKQKQLTFDKISILLDKYGFNFEEKTLFFDKFYNYNFDNKKLLNEFDNLEIKITSKISTDVRFYNKINTEIGKMYTSVIIPKRVMAKIELERKSEYTKSISKLLDKYDFNTEDKNVIYSKIDVYLFKDIQPKDIESVKFSLEYMPMINLKFCNKYSLTCKSIMINKSDVSKSFIKTVKRNN